VLACLSELSILVSLTPAGLGVVEAVVGVGAAALGLPPAVAVAATALRRGANVAVAGLIGGATLGRAAFRRS